MIRWILLLVLVLLVLRAVRALLPAGQVRRAGGAAPQRWDPYAELGVPRDAPREAITRAYHEQLKRYHPDRVADLGTELQHLAHQKTIDLQRAYKEVMR